MIAAIDTTTVALSETFMHYSGGLKSMKQKIKSPVPTDFLQSCTSVIACILYLENCQISINFQ